MPKQNKDLMSKAAAAENPIDQTYWESRWQSNNIGWDVGKATPAITLYMDQFVHKDAAILIPGCGNAYEAEYLLENGFTAITLVDISPKAVSLLKEKFKNEAKVKVINADFFDLAGRFDLIIEQTFFCAIPPLKRQAYAAKTAELLNENGRIIGLLFNRNFEAHGPPFGGERDEYIAIFEPYFVIHQMENCYNSILPRVNSELFINLIKK